MKGVVSRVLVPGISGGLASLMVFGFLQVVAATPSAPASSVANAAAFERSPAEPVIDPMAGLSAPSSSTSPAASATPSATVTATPTATPSVVAPSVAPSAAPSVAASAVPKPPPAKAPKPADLGRLARTGKGGQFVSLTMHERQVIRQGRWTELRFDGEQSDRLGWHANGDSTIVPSRTGVALVCYKVTWADDHDPDQYYAQIARDPGGRIDVTGAEDAANNPGKDYRALCWTMTVRKGQPLAVRVKHDGRGPTVVEFAEFKVWIP